MRQILYCSILRCGSRLGEVNSLTQRHITHKRQSCNCLQKLSFLFFSIIPCRSLFICSVFLENQLHVLMILFLSLCFYFIYSFYLFFSVPFVISGNGCEFIPFQSFCLSAFKVRDFPPSAAVILL